MGDNSLTYTVYNRDTGEVANQWNTGPTQNTPDNVVTDAQGNTITTDDTGVTSEPNQSLLGSLNPFGEGFSNPFAPGGALDPSNAWNSLISSIGTPLAIGAAILVGVLVLGVGGYFFLKTAGEHAAGRVV